MHNSQKEHQVLTLDKTAKVSNQCVLQTATAMIFNEAESGISKELKLKITGSISFTTSGMGESQESFNSNEVQVTPKGLRTPKKLKNLPMHTEEKLTTSLTTAELSEEDLNFTSSSNIVVARQTPARTSISPDLLIGQDLLSTFIDYSSPVLTLPSGLILTPTVFGYTISGTSPITTKATAAEIHLNELVLATSIGDCRKTSQLREGTVTPRLILNGNHKFKDNFIVAHHSKSSGCTPYDGDKGGPDYCTASQALSDYGSRIALLQVKKSAERDSKKIEVPPKAKKALGRKPFKKKKESSTDCVRNTLMITPALSDATTRMCESLPALQQRYRMRNQWLYRHWLFKEKSHLSDSRQAKKRRPSTCATTRILDTSSASRYRHGR
ncbi:hypothetical protein Y032_0050g1960 [Ancylostoma ceylanicum]|nr:hypothetical protein Y032_0050g1960 [Ancylostoma ceylanicum]